MFRVNQLVGFGAGRRRGIQFVGGAIASKVGAAAGNSTIPLNSGLTGGIEAAARPGDFVLAAFSTGSSVDRTLAITDGTLDYTLIGSELSNAGSSSHHNLRVARKFITSDTDTTFGPTGNTSDAGAMAVYVFRGVDTSTPLDVAVTTATGTLNWGPNPPSITPITPGAFIVCLGGSASQVADVAPSNPGGVSDFFSIGQSDTYRTGLGICHKDDWISGAFDCPAFGGGAEAGSVFSAMTIALRPAP